MFEHIVRVCRYTDCYAVSRLKATLCHVEEECFFFLPRTNRERIQSTILWQTYALYRDLEDMNHLVIVQ